MPKQIVVPYIAGKEGWEGAVIKDNVFAGVVSQKDEWMPTALWRLLLDHPEITRFTITINIEEPDNG